MYDIYPKEQREAAHVNAYHHHIKLHEPSSLDHPPLILRLSHDTLIPSFFFFFFFTFHRSTIQTLKHGFKRTHKGEEERARPSFTPHVGLFERPRL